MQETHRITIITTSEKKKNKKTFRTLAPQPHSNDRPPSRQNGRWKKTGPILCAAGGLRWNSDSVTTAGFPIRERRIGDSTGAEKKKKRNKQVNRTWYKWNWSPPFRCELLTTQRSSWQWPWFVMQVIPGLLICKFQHISIASLWPLLQCERPELLVAVLQPATFRWPKMGPTTYAPRKLAVSSSVFAMGDFLSTTKTIMKSLDKVTYSMLPKSSHWRKTQVFEFLWWRYDVTLRWNSAQIANNPQLSPLARCQLSSYTELWLVIFEPNLPVPRAYGLGHPDPGHLGSNPQVEPVKWWFSQVPVNGQE